MPTIRPAQPEDALAICAIYNPFVASSIVTFEEKAVSAGEMSERIRRVSAELPWLVFREGAPAGEKILGYAYATPWKARPAYRFAVETTVYVDPEVSGRGVGTRLYGELLDRLRQLGAHCALGGIALPNDASVALHEKLGFTKIGQLKEVGRKLDRWIDVGYWQLML